MAAPEPTYEYTTPNWAPLHLVVPATQADLFMWMHGCTYADGFRLEAYKHVITRQYLLLDSRGCAYTHGEDGALQPVEVRSALDAVADMLESLGWPRDATRRTRLAGRRRPPRPVATTGPDAEDAARGPVARLRAPSAPSTKMARTRVALSGHRGRASAGPPPLARRSLPSSGTRASGASQLAGLCSSAPATGLRPGGRPRPCS